jgi:hypothetical protein
MAQYEDFSIDAGTDVTIRLELFNPDGSRKILNMADSAGNGIVPMFLVKAQAKKSFTSTDSDDIITFTTTTLQPGNEENIAQISLSNLQTMSMKKGRWVYDVELHATDSDQNIISIERILEGKLTINQNVTTI